MEQGTQTNEEVHVLSTSSFLHEESRVAAPLPAASATGQHQLTGPVDGGCSSDAQLKQLNDEITKLTKFRVKVSGSNFLHYLAPHYFLFCSLHRKGSDPQVKIKAKKFHICLIKKLHVSLL